MWRLYIFMKGTHMHQELTMNGTKDFKLTGLDNSDIIFRNFAGVEKQYNTEGDRNFCVRLDPDVANTLAEYGVPIKILDPRAEDDEPTRFMKVKIKDWSKIYSATVNQRWPEDMTLAQRMEKQLLSDKALYSLDDPANINSAWLVCTFYHWTMGQASKKSGISVSLEKGFFKLEPNEMESKFFGIPDGESPMNTITFEAIKKKIED